MVKKPIWFLNGLMAGCGAAIALTLWAAGCHLSDGLSSAQTLVTALLLSRDIVLWAVIRQLKKRLLLSRDREERRHPSTV